MQRIDGVETAEVSLNRGEAVMTFRPDNQVGIRRVRDLIHSNGFTPREADVHIRGRVVERDGGLALALAGQEGVHPLVNHPDLTPVIRGLREAALGRWVAIYGRVPETPRRSGQMEIIEVRSFATLPDP
ncbi:MAG TPA: heavy-metal-associated domain-containing protein [Gemmatimonadaceae bacterium]|nr:heavy-metal-associated domain-containing protein [Gemmatimonadaceae bacterium]